MSSLPRRARANLGRDYTVVSSLLFLGLENSIDENLVPHVSWGLGCAL